MKGAALNSPVLTSMQFFTLVTFNCVAALSKLSTKNPDLNLFSPLESPMNRLEVSDSSNDSDV